jgi:hypothetical protein
MVTIYISSTYSDLKDLRKAVYDRLQKMQHHVIAMEDYVATDQRPLDKCLADVDKCNFYIGIFAWRYGYIPPEGNPEEKSVTELEFRHAKEKGKECLLFLLDEEAPWPVAQIEGGTGHDRIVGLRNELRRDYLVSLIKKSEDLAAEVGTAVYVALASTRDDALPKLLEDASFDPFEPLPSDPLLDIASQIGRAISASPGAKSVIVDLGTGMNWWSTRLYVLAALAADFTQISQIVFVQQDRFIGTSSPLAIRRALAAKHPEVELAYRNSTLPPGAGATSSKEEEVAKVVEGFIINMPRMIEVGIREWVTQEKLGHWLGIDLSLETVKLQSPELPTKSWLISQIIESGSPIVALTYNQKLVKVVDRLELAVSIARDALKMVD